MLNRQRFLQKLGFQAPEAVQKQIDEQQRQQNEQLKKQIEENQKQQLRESINKSVTSSRIEEQKEQPKTASSTQGESFSSQRGKQDTEILAPYQQKPLPFDEEISKYFDHPVIMHEEKEESTADDDDDDRVNDLQTEPQMQHTVSIKKPRLQLSQSFLNRDGDFLINYYIKDDNQKIRNKYINKLISNKILRQEPSKKHQTMIIFDWDDTLFCTSQLHAQRFENITSDQQKQLLNLDKSASMVLKEACHYGETYIITNAAQGWVEYSSKNFLPTVYKYLDEYKIKVISARSLYESQYPNQCHQWKVEAFRDIKINFDKQIITNLICLGDSHIEIEAAHMLAKEFDQSFIKTVKFKEQPRIEELIKQQDLVRDKLEQIYTNFKNLTIRLEKKQNPKEVAKK
ncbi:kinase, putative (macronuclear) [Tetrahymena thermophila SB210]|uniref:Kinase, putative n=1 Tax=Tetrahymena thermophila (strain SB210) TaxID=312017 RepID=Q23YT7_TETTS|nr:kinase, putative [Tetrahymena thermophila SB210]EAS01718.2 kinase, putative [Tetrahymena thermophila SB210]|eukprot:XP_001021963.2 kinase, putative [Tetrahymena thermophila SB210]